MYQRIVGASTGAGGVIAATVLPNTGSNDTLITVAASVLAGLVAWGVTYVQVNKAV